MPFCFAPCLTGFVLLKPAVAASIHHYEGPPNLSRSRDKSDIFTILEVKNLTLRPSIQYLPVTHLKWAVIKSKKCVPCWDRINDPQI